MEILNFIFSVILPAFIAVVFITTMIDVYIILPIVCNVEENIIRKEL